MTVAFNNMPSNIRTSLYFAEFNAGAAPYSSASRQVLSGHALSGWPVAGNLVDIGGANPNTLFGKGSMLAEMALYARNMDPLGAITALVTPEPAGGTKAAVTVTFTGPATQSGSLTRYISGNAVTIAVAAGDTATVIATNFAAAVAAGYSKFNIAMGHCATAAAAAGVVTLTAVHVGSSGNMLNVFAGLQGEVDPPGVGVALSTVYFSTGAGEVVMATALALLGAENAEWICGPWASTTQLNDVQSFLANSGAGRWSPTVQKGGHYITAANYTLSAATAFGVARNDAHATIVAMRNMPLSPWAFAACINGAVGRSKNLAAPLSEATEIARPLNTIVLDGILPPLLETDYWQRADREALYNNGMAAYTVNRSGQVVLERLPTTYQRNAAGNSDITFLDIETMAISEYVGRYMRQRIESLYPRCVLVDDNPRGNQGVVTAAQARTAMIHAYTELYNSSLVQRPDLFAKYLICERSTDPNRLNSFLPIGVANQLRVFAANISIYLQLTDNLIGG